MVRMWHGGRKWDGKPEIRPCTAKRYECGPGIYFTTALSTAVKYAKGGGMVMEAHLSDDIGWAEEVRVPYAEMRAFVETTSGLRRKKEILADLENSFEREKPEDGCLPSIYLVNLCVNHEALLGRHGPELASWLSERGAQASLSRMSGEDWVVVFDPSLIVKMKKVPASEQDWKNSDLPSVREQVEHARLSRAVQSPRQDTAPHPR